MSVGIVMLCHTALDRAAEVARHWATRGCPVVIHVDKRVKRRPFDGLVRSLADLPNVRHVYLASGSCLPLRPVDEMVAYLNERPRTDLIESVTTEDVGWTIGGLGVERFTLRFPFSWRTRRRLFDGYV